MRFPSQLGGLPATSIRSRLEFDFDSILIEFDLQTILRRLEDGVGQLSTAVPGIGRLFLRGPPRLLLAEGSGRRQGMAGEEGPHLIKFDD